MTGYQMAMKDTRSAKPSGNKTVNLTGLKTGQVGWVSVTPDGKVVSRHSWLPPVKTVEEAQAAWNKL